jgi:hypothetical protein
MRITQICSGLPDLVYLKELEISERLPGVFGLHVCISAPMSEYQIKDFCVDNRCRCGVKMPEESGPNNILLHSGLPILVSPEELKYQSGRPGSWDLSAYLAQGHVPVTFSVLSAWCDVRGD